ncbi:hypothetical protein [Longimicrobium sp.]|uniref:hypothetical protein n=1 Tax=Longimicrobium sp. TaxID=2029185 RepID=UPI002CAA8ADF|nr:hypothetical protein [Longimicrobium sp.]HSU17893.1 hypothetical protein [Longimicrobium sp.]
MEGLPKWLIFHVAFGSVPYFASVALRYFKDGDGNPWRSSPEIIFLVLVACSSALAEISFGHRRTSPLRHTFQVALGTGVVLAAIAYGAYLGDELSSPGREAGIDCEIVAEAASTASAVTAADPLVETIRRQWGAPCSRWERRRERYFVFSKRVAIIFTILGAFAIFCFPPSRRGGL